MLQLHSLKLDHLKGTFYSIHFQRIKFLLPDVFYPEYLDLYDKEKNQQFGKIKVRLCVDWFKNYKPFFVDTNYIILTQYQQIALIPYILRIQPNIQIIATNLMYELIRIYIQQLHSTFNQINITHQISANDEHERQGQYQQAFSMDFKDYWSIFTKKEIQEMFTKIIRVNYYQIYNTEQGVSLIPYPSGKNNGSCFWSFINVITKDKFMLINDISQHQWRTNPTYNTSRLLISQNQNPFTYLIFTERALARLNQENQDIKTAEKIKKINKNLNEYINTILVLNDQTFAIDLIPRIPIQPEGKCQMILFSSKSFHQITNYCNSYVDYLSEHFRNHIYQEVPDFPLYQYCRYFQKGGIGLGGLEQVSIMNKLPIKEIVLQKSPMLIIIKDYQYKLNVHNLQPLQKLVKHEYIHFNLENNFTNQLFISFVAIFPKAKVITFNTQSLNANSQDLKFNMKYTLPCNYPSKYHINACNMTTSPLHKYKLANNQLELSLPQKQYLVISKKIMQQIFNELIKKGICIIQKDKSTLKTEKSHLQLLNYKLKVISNSIEEILIIEKYLSNAITAYSL